MKVLSGGSAAASFDVAARVAREDQEVIRMSQWAEIREMHLVEGVPKRELARRFNVDVKTVRRAIATGAPPTVRSSPSRGQGLDSHRERIVGLLKQDRKLTAKRIGRLIAPGLSRPAAERTVRQYVAEIKRELFVKEAFVHRTHAPGDTMEIDFGESAAFVAGELVRVKFLVATLPASNAYFAKLYPVERLECLLDGIVAAFRHFGGLPRRLVLDNTSLAVHEVLRGPDRTETAGFKAFRGALPVHVDFCAPAKGWEKGSVEGGVGYTRDNGFRPMPRVASLEALGVEIAATFEEDLDRRRLADGRTAREALEEERRHLRPLPAHLPETCRVLLGVADKYGHVAADHARYSVPTKHARRPVVVKLFHDRVEIAVDADVVAVHPRSFVRGANVIDALHVLDLLGHKHRAVSESTAIQQWRLPPVLHDLRAALAERVRKPDREWIEVLKLSAGRGVAPLALAVAEAMAHGSPRLATIQEILRKKEAPDLPPTAVAAVARADLRALVVAPPSLRSYDVLGEVAR